MVWECFFATGPTHLIIDRSMNSKGFKDILHQNLLWNRKEDMCCNKTLIQYWSRSTTELFQHNKIRVLEWSRQSPEFNPIEMLWHDLKRAIHFLRHPKNFAQQKSFCEEKSLVVIGWSYCFHRRVNPQTVDVDLHSEQANKANLLSVYVEFWSQLHYSEWDKNKN